LAPSAICSSTTFTYTPTSSTSGASFSSSRATITGISPAGPVSSTGNIAETLQNTTASPIVVTYAFTTSATGCSTNQNVVFTVNPSPILISTTSPPSICSGTQFGYTPTSSTSGTTYSWTVVSTNVTGASSGSGSVISQLLNSANGTSSGSVTYTITPSANGCAGANVDVTVSVNPNPVLTIANANPQICSGGITNISFTSATNGHRVNVVSVDYGLVSGGTVTAGITTFTNGTTLAETLTNTTNAAIDVVYVFNITTPFTSPTCPLTTAEQTIVVRVQPTPTFTFTNAITQLCSGIQTDITVNSTVANAEIRLNTVDYGLASGNLSSGALYTDGQRITEVLTNSTNASVTVTYTFEAIVGTCAPSATQTATVVVKPTPILTNTSDTLTEIICSDTPLNFVPTTNPTATVNWTAAFNPAEIAAATVTVSGTDSITNAPRNITYRSSLVTYTLTPVVNSCVGIPRDYVVSVKPIPTITTNNVVICSESPAQFNLSAAPQNVAGTTFSWTVTTADIVSGQANGDGSSINQLLTTNASGAVVTYNITPAANGCNGPTAIYTATVNPKAIVNAGLDFSLCEPANVPLTLGSVAGGATAANWSVVSGQGFGSVAGTGLLDTYTVAPADISVNVGNTVKLLLTTNDPDGAGPCPVAVDDLVVTLNRQANVTAPANYTLCEPSSFVLNSALSGSATGGSWLIVTPSANGTLTVSRVVAGSEVDADYIPSYVPLATDANTAIEFLITTNDPDGLGPCLADTDNVVVTINESAKVVAGSDFEVCEDEPLVLNGSKSGSPATITWTGGTGTFVDASTTITGYALSPAEFNGLNQSILFRLTASDPDGLGPCTVVFDEVNVIVNDTTEVALATDRDFYTNIDPREALFHSPTGGVFSGSGILAGESYFYPEFVDPLGFATIKYTFQSGITGCTSIITKTVIVNPVTDIDFNLDPNSGATNEGLNKVNVCADIGDVELIGIPDNSTELKPLPVSGVFTSPATPEIIKKDGLDYYLITDNREGGVYFVHFTYTNEFNASNTLIKEINIYSSPIATIKGLKDGGLVTNPADWINSVDGCVEDEVQFIGKASSIKNDVAQPGAVIDSYTWNFDDNLGELTFQDPLRPFTDSRVYNVSLTVTTENGCSNTTIAPVLVGEPPKVDFIWSKVCSGDVTEFTNLSKTGISKALEVTWDFGDTNSISKTPLTAADTMNTNTDWNPFYSYGTALAYDITLTVKTEEGCDASLTKNAFILISGSADVIAANGYREDFKSGQGTWFPTNTTFENVTTTDWLFGVPDGTTINMAIDNAWYMRTYKNIESSVVIGPCLDLSTLNRPMISLDFWVDTDEELDGAVVQYSTDEGQSWETIGDDKKLGINWYNNSPITGNPGDQSFGQYGWSGKSGGWVTARYNLDMIDRLNRDKVVFRIAFGPNNPTATRTLNGFAFDNIYIGEKNRSVLVEHFTNNGDALSVTRNGRIDNDYDNQFIQKNSSDFIKLQCHIANPGEDAYNENNTADPAARSLFYGVQSPPFTIMNGLIGMYEVGDFNVLEINHDGDYPFHSNNNPGITAAQIIDMESLRSPKFDVDLVLDGNAGTVTATKIDYDFKVTYADSINSNFTTPVVLHIALYETIATDGGLAVRNVLRKMLTGSGGITVTQNWTWSSSPLPPTTRSGSSDLDINFQNPDSLYVVAFVQNKNTQEIYQVIKQKVSNTKTPRVIAGVDNNLVKVELESIEMYPNPANQHVNLFTEGILSKRYLWKIITQQGVEVLSGDLEREFLEPEVIDTNLLANGIYFMVLGTEEKPLIYKKLAVVNRR
jgi:hypothetical protein